LADQVYEYLEKEIVEGRLRPGDRIMEKDLSRRLGISRTPIREALLKLGMVGIVSCTSRRSYKVRVLTAKDVKEIFEILGILEAAVVGSVISAITTADLDSLRQYNRRMAEAGERGDFHVYGSWNEQFHDVFISKYPNRSLRDLCDTVRRLFYTFPVRHDSLNAWIEKSVQEHEEIIRLAAARDGQALRSYIQDVHWGRGSHSRYIEDAFAGEGPGTSASDGQEDTFGGTIGPSIGSVGVGAGLEKSLNH